VLAAILSAGGPWAPGHEATITTTAADLATLLGPDAADRYQLDRLHVADSLDNALTHLERQLLRRARIAADHDGSDLTTLHHHHHDDDQPLPPIVFLTQAPEGTIATALAAILAVGSRLAIAGVLLGPWSAGATWHVNTDGTTRPDHATDTTGPRLNVLAPAATGDLLDTLRQARPASNDLPPPPPRQAPPILRTAVAPMPASPATSAAPPAVEVHSGAPTPATAPATAITQPQVPPDSARAPDDPQLRLSVLGKPALHLVVGDTHINVRIRRSDGVQILVHLAVEPDGATSDQLMAVLWPETRSYFSRGRFHTTMSELRQTLAEAVGAEAIPRTDERYRLDSAHIDVDLWRLTAAADHAATTVDPTRHALALQEIVKLYTGSVADGHHWLWLAPYRERVRRHVLDAYVGLADTEVDVTGVDVDPVRYLFVRLEELMVDATIAEVPAASRPRSSRSSASSNSCTPSPVSTSAPRRSSWPRSAIPQEHDPAGNGVFNRPRVSQAWVRRMVRSDVRSARLRRHRGFGRLSVWSSQVRVLPLSTGVRDRDTGPRFPAGPDPRAPSRPGAPARSSRRRRVRPCSRRIV